MKFGKVRSIAALALLTSSLAAQVQADQLTDIKSRGTLMCGVLSTLDPFGYMDPATREVVGYDVDFCKGVAKQLGVKAELRQLSLDARIPELNQGRVDILAAVLGYSPARATQIAFTDSYFLALQKLAVQQDSGFSALANMDGKRISSIKGSSTQTFVRAKIPGAKIVSYDDAPTAFMALTQRKVDGFGLTEAMLRRLIVKLGPDSTLKVVDEPLGQEQWGLGVKKDEPELLAAVNAALNNMEKSGEAQAIFDQWLGKNSAYHMERTFKVEPIKP